MLKQISEIVLSKHMDSQKNKIILYTFNICDKHELKTGTYQKNKIIYINYSIIFNRLFYPKRLMGKPNLSSDKHQVQRAILC